MGPSLLAVRMQENGITVTATHLHVVWFDDQGKRLDHPVDKWYVLVSFEDRSFGTFYTTGMGHRELYQRLGHWEQKGSRYSNSMYGGSLTLAEMISNNHLRLPKKGPRADYILQALLMDAQFGSESFKEFCNSSGVNSDSISSLQTYLKCQETRESLLRMFGHKLLSELNKDASEL